MADSKLVTDYEQNVMGVVDILDSYIGYAPGPVGEMAVVLGDILIEANSIIELPDRVIEYVIDIVERYKHHGHDVSKELKWLNDIQITSQSLKRVNCV